MKKLAIITFILTMLLPWQANCQVKRVSTDTKSFHFSYLESPKKPEFYANDPEHKYAVIGDYEPSFEMYYKAQAAEEAIYINGWQKVWENDNPSVLVRFSATDLKSKAEVLDRVEKRKGKHDEEIIEHFYRARIVYGEGKLSYRIEDAATHQYISGYNTSSNTIVHEYLSAEYRKRRDAERDLNNNIDVQRLNALKKWNDDIVMRISNDGSRIIGWTIDKQKISLKVTDEKKFDENSITQQHYNATRRIIEGMDPRQDLTELEERLQPEILYYKSLLEKYPNSKDTKIDGRMRALALYNISAIYFALERFDVAERYANEYIGNGYEPKDAKKIFDRIDDVKEYFSKNGVTTLHPQIQMYN